LLNHGCHSAAAFPLQTDEENSGSFVVYAGEEGFFHEQELNILAEAAGDISYALSKIKMDEDRKKIEADLRDRLEELERFQKATIEREGRIKELRDELKKSKDKKESD
jgi:GAF domain-containing protein